MDLRNSVSSACLQLFAYFLSGLVPEPIYFFASVAWLSSGVYEWIILNYEMHFEQSLLTNFEVINFVFKI